MGYFEFLTLKALALKAQLIKAMGVSPWSEGATYISQRCKQMDYIFKVISGFWPE
jgi:hypothetical protein